MPLGGTQYFVIANAKLSKHENAFFNPAILNHFRAMNYFQTLMKLIFLQWKKRYIHKKLGIKLRDGHDVWKEMLNSD